jgi:hypothetical protein
MAKKAPRKAAPRKPSKKKKPAAAKGRSKPKKAAKPARTPKPAKKAKSPKAKPSRTPSKPIPVARKAPGLDRARKQLSEIDEPRGLPSSLNPDRLRPSAARSGRSALKHARKGRTETSPVLTGGDVDADWEDAYAVGDEAPGGDNPTPDQDRVDDIGRAMGIEYADNEELKGGDKISDRDRHRWELDPASAEDYPDHDDE